MTVSGTADIGRQSNWLADWAGVLVVAAAFAASILAAIYHGVIELSPFYAENGPVEMSSVVILLVTAALYALWRGRIGAHSLVPAFVLLLMAAREVDAHKWFTEKSVLSTRFYFDNPDVSYAVRLLAGIVVAAIALTILRFLWKIRNSFLTALREVRPFCCTIVLGVGMLMLGLVLDGIGRKVTALTGLRLSAWARELSVILEETAEAAMALAFLVALLQLRFYPGRNAIPDATVDPAAGRR